MENRCGEQATHGLPIELYIEIVNGLDLQGMLFSKAIPLQMMPVLNSTLAMALLLIYSNNFMNSMHSN